MIVSHWGSDEQTGYRSPLIFLCIVLPNSTIIFKMSPQVSVGCRQSNLPEARLVNRFITGAKRKEQNNMIRFFFLILFIPKPKKTQSS